MPKQDDMKMANVPNTTEAKLFEKLVMSGFTPIKEHIEHGKLGNQLTDEDARIIGDAITAGIVSWLKWLRHLEAHKQDRGNYGE